MTFLYTVPDDVFAQNYIWKGSYNFKGRKQPMTLTVTSFNASTGRVNATLSNRDMELLLSGNRFKFSKRSYTSRHLLSTLYYCELFLMLDLDECQNLLKRKNFEGL